ncbi:MAG TPA: hypothetical protein PKD32_00915 [Saprospiraceae bacterium]|nr:hypothetical protein [Saprospiraceae bacterium]
MRRLFFICLIILPLLSYSQVKKMSPKQNSNPYPLKTADHLVFSDKFDTVQLYNDFTSIGYASALKDKRKVKMYPIATSQIRENEIFNNLTVYFLFGDGETMGLIEFPDTKFKKGVFEVKNAISMKDGYYIIVIQHGCSPREFYKIPVKESAKSFLKIISYNEETGELKARFRVHFLMDDIDEKYYPNSPKAVLFEDGVIHTTVFKIYE